MKTLVESGQAGDENHQAEYLLETAPEIAGWWIHRLVAHYRREWGGTGQTEISIRFLNKKTEYILKQNPHRALAFRGQVGIELTETPISSILRFYYCRRSTLPDLDASKLREELMLDIKAICAWLESEPSHDTPGTNKIEISSTR